MILAHTLAAMNAQRQNKIVGISKKKSTEKLSSGYKINRAADDAAGLTISENMRLQIRGLLQGIDNAQDGISMNQIADGALSEVQDMLHRLTELSVKSANGTSTKEDRKAIQTEVNELLKEIDRISENTEFNTIKIFDTGTINVAGNGGGNGSNVHVNKWTTGINSVSVKGTPNDYNISTYSFTASEDRGISINGQIFDWSSIKSSNGESIDGLKAGTYTIEYNGISFMMNLLDKSTLQDVATSMNGVNAITTGASERKTWTVTHSYKIPYKNIAYGGSSSRVFHISNDSIYFDDDTSYSYSLSNRDWNDILNISLDANKSSKSTYDVSGALMLVDGHTYGNFSIVSNLTKNGNFTRSELINEMDGKNVLIINLDEELYHGSRYVVSITGTYEIEQSNGNTKVDGPFPVENKEITDDKGNIISGDMSLYKQIWIQSGAKKEDGIWLYFGEMNTKVLGISGLDVSTETMAGNATDKVCKALSYVSNTRSRIGAQQNRLEHVILNEENIVENTQDAESRIRDTDMASEMVNNTKQNILEQAVTNMMAQANQSIQGVLSLLP